MRNYLRARGEYQKGRTALHQFLELPPRTRRILDRFADLKHTSGTTSAHAENTPGKPAYTSTTGNYLRARGEYGATPIYPPPLEELPPRTRRILSPCSSVLILAGTTSAHAENTYRRTRAAPGRRNYLRARGEYCRALNTGMTTLELPPRTRRIRGENQAAGGC